MISLPENGFIADIINSKLNISLVCVCCYLLYKIVKPKFQKPAEVEPVLEKLKVRDFTISELREFDGREENQNRILIAINGKVFDATSGKKFYGKGGPYGVFAGRDASRALATFSLDEDSFSDNLEYDDLSDLKAEQMEGVIEWQQQFNEKYQYVGNLLKPGQSPTDYSILNKFGDAIVDDSVNATGDAKSKDD